MGEFELLAKLRERLPAAGPRVALGSGDDAAVTVPGGATATSVDAIVEGVHFRRGEADLATVGRKALATALSDLAAMGAEAGEAYVVLGAPGDLGEGDFHALLDGMLELARATGTAVAGGDLTRAPVLTLAVTVVGHAATASDFVTRGGAAAGDLLVLTGEVGGAAAGRLLLDDPSLAGAVSEDAAARLRARQLDPSPRLRSGRALAQAGATAMIDLSDGLAGDAAHLASASGVRLAAARQGPRRSRRRRRAGPTAAGRRRWRGLRAAGGAAGGHPRRGLAADRRSRGDDPHPDRQGLGRSRGRVQAARGRTTGGRGL
jgi:thiamine-monophosphate kinase